MNTQLVTEIAEEVAGFPEEWEPRDFWEAYRVERADNHRLRAALHRMIELHGLKLDPENVPSDVLEMGAASTFLHPRGVRND